jgi:hypothetical protein
MHTVFSHHHFVCLFVFDAEVNASKHKVRKDVWALTHLRDAACRLTLASLTFFLSSHVGVLTHLRHVRPTARRLSSHMSSHTFSPFAIVRTSHDSQQTQSVEQRGEITSYTRCCAWTPTASSRRRVNPTARA